MKKKPNELVSNRKALHDYELIDIFEAVLSLVGTEVKSLREHHGSLAESYVKIIRGEAYLVGCQIPHYKFGNIHNHEEKRDRKLLLHKKEIEILNKAQKEKGLAIIPLALYLSKGKIKLKIASAKGKKAQDKRQKIKEREDQIRMKRAIKDHT